MAIKLNTNPVFLDPELAEILQYERNIGGGTNLAGQGGGGLANRLRNQVQETDPYAYGSYVIPASDPTYSSGFNYARTIAGGMPFEDVVAPGMSFSPEEPMGYTQADLRKKEIYGDFDGVMPVAPTKGTPFAPNEGFVQMPSAPQGVSAPTRILPEQTPFPGIPNYLKDLDFSNLPRLEDIKGVEDIKPSLLDVDVEEILKDVDTLKNIDTEKFADIDFSGIDIPPVATKMPKLPDFSNIPTPENVSTSFMPGSGMGRIGQGVATDRESLIGKKIFGQTITPESFSERETARSPFLRAVARPDLPAPEFSFGGKLTPAPTMPQVQTMPQTPVIPNIPVMPKVPVMPQPIVLQPIPPMNFTGLSNLPVSNFVQPNVEDIVSPISRGRILPKTPRGLFTL